MRRLMDIPQTIPSVVTNLRLRNSTSTTRQSLKETRER